MRRLLLVVAAVSVLVLPGCEMLGLGGKKKATTKAAAGTKAPAKAATKAK